MRKKKRKRKKNLNRMIFIVYQPNYKNSKAKCRHYHPTKKTKETILSRENSTNLIVIMIVVMMVILMTMIIIAVNFIFINKLKKNDFNYSNTLLKYQNNKTLNIKH
jgi:cbb3-type cytochrome oxidase subunit 3